MEAAGLGLRVKPQNLKSPNAYQIRVLPRIRCLRCLGFLPKVSRSALPFKPSAVQSIDLTSLIFYFLSGFSLSCCLSSCIPSSPLERGKGPKPVQFHLLEFQLECQGLESQGKSQSPKFFLSIQVEVIVSMVGLTRFLLLKARRIDRFLDLEISFISLARNNQKNQEQLILDQYQKKAGSRASEFESSLF